MEEVQLPGIVQLQTLAVVVEVVVMFLLVCLAAQAVQV
jgi:hypothetical protein